MPKRHAFLCILPLVLSTSSYAQNVNDLINIFRGVVNAAMVHEAQFEWRKLPPNETACIDQALRQENSSVDALIARGVMPFDQRLSQLRSNCRVQVGQLTVQSVSAQPSSLWDHNGSIVSLEASGKFRKFRYEAPKQGLIAVGVRKGTLLFEGQTDGKRYFGTAYVFKPKCGALPYQVSGPILNDSRTVEMEGQAPSVNERTCRIIGFITDKLTFNYRDDLSTPQQPPIIVQAPIVEQPKPASPAPPPPVSSSIQSASVDPSPNVEKPASPASISVPMQMAGGTYVVPVVINDAITLNFVVDSGAADVSIPADVVMTLMRTGTLKESDFLGQRTYVLADGTEVPSQTFRIRSLKVGNRAFENVTGSVASVKGSLLLGQSFLSRFTSWSIDNTKHVLILE